MTAIAVIHVLCETNPSLGTSIVNGLLAGATVLGGFTALGSGLLATISMFVTVRPEARTSAINLGLAWGFVGGIAIGSVTLFVFIARIVT